EGGAQGVGRCPVRANRILCACLGVAMASGCARSPRAVELEPTSASPAPAAPAAAVSSVPLDRSVAPELGPPPALALPPVVECTLPNGLRLLVVEHHELPVADFILLVGTGGEADPAGKPGVATLVASML